MSDNLIIDKAQVLADIRAAKEKYPTFTQLSTKDKIMQVLEIASENDELPLTGKQIAQVVGLSANTISEHCRSLLDDGKISQTRPHTNTAWLWSLPLVAESVTDDNSCKKTQPRP